MKVLVYKKKSFLVLKFVMVTLWNRADHYIFML